MNYNSLETSIKLFKALADGSRLKILSTLLDSPKYVEIIAERLGLAPSTVSFHLKKLEETGLVEKEKDQYYVMYSVKKELLSMPISHWVSLYYSGSDIDYEREVAYKKKVIETFFKFNKLVSIPVQLKKRRIVLEHMINVFEYNKEYSEKEVNIMIADFHDDFATLRREFINEKLLVRKNSIYRRS